MENFKTIKLTDLIQGEKIDAQALSQIKGGTDIMLMDGCYSGICSIQVNPAYCEGGAVCTHGVAG